MKKIHAVCLIVLAVVVLHLVTGCASPTVKKAFSAPEYKASRILVNVGYDDRQGYFEEWQVTVTNNSGVAIAVQAHRDTREVTLHFADEAKPRVFFDSMMDYKLTPKYLRQSADRQFLYLVAEGRLQGNYENEAYVYDLDNRTYLGDETIDAFAYPE
jgi:hypothetical protein